MGGPLDITFSPMTYTEFIDDDDESENEPPHEIECSLCLVLNGRTSQWHVKVTFQGILESISSWLQRKNDLENLCSLIDFDRLPLLHDTVTELILSNIQHEPCDTYTRVVNNLRIMLRENIAIASPLPQSTQLRRKSVYARVANNLGIILRKNIAIVSPVPQNVPVKKGYHRITNNIRIILQKNIAIAPPLRQSMPPSNLYTCAVNNLQVTLREDPARVRFPVYNNRRIATKDLDLIKKERELAPGVYLVHSDNKPYVLKEIEKPLYQPIDTDIWLQELQNLETLRNVSGIVQLVAVVTSPNPYQTFKHGTKNSIVARGLLLEYYPNGTLRDALLSSDFKQPWKQWALQLASTLHHMHNHGITHMDVKPSNIVIDVNLELVVIDVGGRAFSHEWLSPEMRNLDYPPSENISSRVLNDIWAFGNLVLQMSNASHDELEKEILDDLASCCTAPVSQRISLGDAIMRLKQ
ncbi:kinase-like domain-containing protein [Nemania sp. NC0429]|nr:kinase-like domain-containing protein [Nemania sp. NC0429]